MSFYFEGNAYIDPAYIINSSISNSSITTSSLDMNLENITSVKDPILPQDAATKKYVDDLLFFKTTDVSLSGTSGSFVLSPTKGSFMVKVSNLVSNGPSALFNISKSEHPRAGQVHRINATPGNSSDTTLLLEWVANSGLYLRKTSDLYDGSYNVVMI
jgi:hypothetical protein